MNWLDIVIIAILLINIVKGLQSGFVTAFFGLSGMIASVFTALFYHNRVSLYLNSNYDLIGKTKRFLESKLTIPLETAGTHLNDMARSQLQQTISNLSLPEPLKNLLVKNADAANINFFGGMATVGNYVTTFVSNMVVNIISFMIVFMAVKLMFSVISFFLDRLVQREGMGFYNRLAGLGFGAIKGVIIIMIFATVLTPIITVVSAESINKAVETSKMFKFFYVYNFIPALLSRFIT